jgi:hypothetical protein
MIRKANNKIKVKCRADRVDGKSGKKTVLVKSHKRSTPTSLPRKCRK